MEINYTFRRLPSAATWQNWVEATPPGFVFAVKANMRITHILRLKNAAQATELFFKMIDPLRTRAPAGAGAVPDSAGDEVRRGAARAIPGAAAARVCATPSSSATPPGWRSRFTTQLRRRNVSLCVAESERLEVPEVITADFVYYRLRKPDYTEADVGHFAARSRELLAAGRDLYLMFKHEETPEGAMNAEKVLGRVRAGS